MLDTVKLKSPPIDEVTAAAVSERCVIRVGVAGDTGARLWEFTTGSLAGSFDSRVRVQVCREEWQTVENGPPVQVECDPYVVIEGSVHKALLGHNVEGGPQDPRAACRWFVAELERRLGVTLPAADSWQVAGMHWAEAYDLGSFEAVEQFLTWLTLARYPRRQVQRYGETGWYASGAWTTVKAYHKGPEFSKHDFKRIERHEKRVWQDHPARGAAQWLTSTSRAVELQLRANRLLRVETEIHSRKLADDFGQRPRIDVITREYLEQVHDAEWLRVMREGADDMRTVRTTQAVSRRLVEVHGDRLGELLFGTWLQLAALGEKEVRRRLAPRTFYRRRAQLVAAGVSWKGADVHVDQVCRLVPEDFTLRRSDPRRLIVEASEVAAALAPYRLIA